MGNLYNRKRLVNQLKQISSWDIIVVGGGSTGLGVALDAASRGYNTLLLEGVDFAKGTSSRSTKLLHGGVRYLAQGNISLVKEALLERDLLLKNAPHLTQVQSFIIPCFSLLSKYKYLIGLKLYDLLAGKRNVGRSHFINKKETSLRLKMLSSDNLLGGIVYYDGQFDDSRMAVNLAQSCVDYGATVLNHFKVDEILKNEAGKVCGVKAIDCETNISYKLNANVVINATGVFTNKIIKMDNAFAQKIIQPSQGVHVVLENTFLSSDAIMIPKTIDGRVLFVIPWKGKVIVGTTDTPVKKCEYEPKALDKEIDFILLTLNNYLKKHVERSDIQSVFVGLRPLAVHKNNRKKTKEISRKHKILISDSNLVTITGGKWTTYRKMAEASIDKVISLGMLEEKKCLTADIKIHGAENSEQLNSIYGSDFEKIKKLRNEHADLQEKIHPSFDYTKAEVVWSIRNEFARTVEDILARRTRTLFLNAQASLDAAPIVAKILAKELNKDNVWTKNQIKAFSILAETYILTPDN
jgi:glycerol-3-phosphate dehydrogenase